jgi:hypothetical protein
VLVCVGCVLDDTICLAACNLRYYHCFLYTSTGLEYSKNLLISIRSLLYATTG